MPEAPPPFRQFVLKLATRCDLACDHCYVYEAADTSWRTKPKTSAEHTLHRTAQRIAEHAAAHRLPVVHVVLHGGEPLLAGRDRLRFALATLTEELQAARVALDLRIHTNGVLLTADLCELFRKYGVRVGVSLDGDRAANDRHRRFADGRSSHPHVLRAVDLLKGEFSDIYSGVLCTIDVANDPVAVYEAVKAAEPPRADFLLPHATHTDPPARPDGSRTPYAAWLLAVYDRWRADGRPFEIRTFDSVLAAFRGEPSGTESLGLEPVDLVVVEADGTLEQADSLKAAYDGAPATGFDVFGHTFDEAAAHSGFAARRHGLADLCRTCRDCPVVGACGGGLRTHRYRAADLAAAAGAPTGGEFDNPSVYCADLKELIMGIRTRIRSEAEARTPDPANHGLSASALDALAHGFGDARAVEALAGFQESLRRDLLVRVMFHSGDAADHVKRAIDLLVGFDRTAPRALAEVLAHPYVRVWALRCLDLAADQALTDADRGHVAAVAAATAIRAGADAELEVPIRDGAVHLPTLGRLAMGRPAIGANEGRVVLRIGSGRCSITEAPGWQPVRRIPLPGFASGELALEDTDPYRDCHHWDVLGRLPDDQALAWQRTLPRAWDLLRSDYEAYAPGIAAGLSTLVPLVPAKSGRDVSATARHAFGSIGAALPTSRGGGTEPDAAALALLLIHEFQHVKLGAVLDMADLHDPADARLFPAPWREDPRPLEGLLQGTYAHIGVTDFWRVRRQTAASEADRANAQAEFVRWRDHTADSIVILEASGSLTPLGLRFTTALRETVEPWLAAGDTRGDLGHRTSDLGGGTLTSP